LVYAKLQVTLNGCLIGGARLQLACTAIAAWSCTESKCKSPYS